jgi:hypothetical protein
LLTLRIGEILWCHLLQSLTATPDWVKPTVNFPRSSAKKFWESFWASDTTRLWLFRLRSMAILIQLQRNICIGLIFMLVGGLLNNYTRI